MCGINGILRLQNHKPPVTREEVIRVRDAMQHRGPDDAGIWMSEHGNIGLGHRRLSIIDLSALGHQPMSWSNQRYWITYNGEIYNYPQLRSELVKQGVDFVSSSDTEVILALYAACGHDCLSRLRGMYAFAIWDSFEQSLFLARDPYGIKPLYYSFANGYFEFASQVKALELSDNISSAVSPAGVTGFLLWGSVPEPHTIRRDISIIPSGHYLYVKQGKSIEPQPFYRAGKSEFLQQNSMADALQDSVRAHLIADVPAGVFLSSGIDSIAIAALAQQTLQTRLKTLTVTFDGFKGTSNDEGPLASEIAKLLGTDHTEVTITSGEFSGLWEEVIRVMDQPSIDGFNTYMVSKIAHQQGLKVVLSGTGGDELLGGYSTFREHRSLAWFSRIAHSIPPLIPLIEKVQKAIIRHRNPKLSLALRYGNSPERRYLLRRGLFLPDELAALVGHEFAREGFKHYSPLNALKGMVQQTDWNAHNDYWLGTHIWESGQYMRNQLLRDSDWASMAHSLELRTPLVDVWLRENIAALNFQPARQYGKAHAARTALPDLPDKVFQRPKTGFQIPAVDWMNETERQLHPGAVSRRLALKTLEAFDIYLPVR